MALSSHLAHACARDEVIILMAAVERETGKGKLSFQPAHQSDKIRQRQRNRKEPRLNIYVLLRTMDPVFNVPSSPAAPPQQISDFYITLVQTAASRWMEGLLTSQLILL